MRYWRAFAAAVDAVVSTPEGEDRTGAGTLVAFARVPSLVDARTA